MFFVFFKTCKSFDLLMQSFLICSPVEGFPYGNTSNDEQETIVSCGETSSGDTIGVLFLLGSTFHGGGGGGVRVALPIQGRFQ